MPVAGGNEFLTEHMVFSRDGQLRCPHVTSTTDKCTLVSRLKAESQHTLMLCSKMGLHGWGTVIASGL